MQSAARESCAAVKGARTLTVAGRECLVQSITADRSQSNSLHARIQHAHTYVIGCTIRFSPTWIESAVGQQLVIVFAAGDDVGCPA